MQKLSINDYQFALNGLKEKIRLSRQKASYTLNNELLKVYWETGKFISERETKEGWGTKIIEKLSSDLRSEFTDMKGFSPRYLRYMREFYISYPAFPELTVSNNIPPEAARTTDSAILQAPLAKLSWYHHISLLDKLKLANYHTHDFILKKNCDKNLTEEEMENISTQVLEHLMNEIEERFQ